MFALVIVIHAERSRGGTVFIAVCLSAFPDDLPKTDAARITRLDVHMFHDEFCKSNYLGSKGQRSKSKRLCRFSD